MYNLPANIENVSLDKLNVLLGFEDEPTGNGLPSLRVNYKDVDGDGNELPRGRWTIYTPEGVQLFAKTCSFRPLASFLQYHHYSKETKKTVSTSVYFRSFRDEVPDDIGGFKCGKVSRKDFEKLSAADQSVQKEIKLSKVLFGELTMEGEDKTGKKYTIENLPCQFYAKGSNFMPITEVIEEITDAKIPLPTVALNMSLKVEQNDGVTYWTVVPKYSKKDRVEVTQATFDLLRKFGETVTAENAQILEKHSAVRAKGISPQQSEIAEAINNASSSLELNDESPIDFIK